MKIKSSRSRTISFAAAGILAAAALSFSEQPGKKDRIPFYEKFPGLSGLTCVLDGRGLHAGAIEEAWRLQSKSAAREIESLIAVYNAQKVGNIVELFFPADAIGSPERFNFIIAVRKYLTNDPPDKPSVSDKTPDTGHYTFP